MKPHVIGRKKNNKFLWFLYSLRIFFVMNGYRGNSCHCRTKIITLVRVSASRQVTRPLRLDRTNGCALSHRLCEAVVGRFIFAQAIPTFLNHLCLCGFDRSTVAIDLTPVGNSCSLPFCIAQTFLKTNLLDSKTNHW